MNKFLTLALLLIVGSLGGAMADESGYESVPVVPTDHGSAVQRLLYARTFELEAAHTYYWRAEQPQITTGTLVVVQVDPDYAFPRQVGMPVLYVGDTPAELANIGYESGRIVAFVPGEVDLTTTPIYFGSTELPERVDAARGRLEQAAAEELGIEPFSVAEVVAAQAAGGEPLIASDSNWLYLEIANVILTYAPQEKALAESYQLYFK